MMAERTVHLFPGLGAYSAGVLHQARREYRQVDETFDDIDRIAAAQGMPTVSEVLFAQSAPSAGELLEDHPAEVAQLAIFGCSVATSRVLDHLGADPELLVGHSFGEMAALVAAGAFDLADGVRLVGARCAALRAWEGRGQMAAIGTTEVAASHLAGLLEEPDLVVGCVNAPRQVVLSGPVTSIDRAEAVARALDLPWARLQLPYASHHPAMHAAVGTFVAMADGVTQLPMRRKVYSPIHGRRYVDGDDLVRALAECLVRPVWFTAAIRELHAQGYTKFVEVGALRALTRCVELTVPGVCTVAPLADPERESEGLRAAAGAERVDIPAPRPERQLSTVDAAVALVAPVAAGGVRTDAEAAPRHDRPPRDDRPGRDSVVDALRGLYAQALEYPPDVLTEEALLEAELGVDSLKQTSLLGRALDRFGLPAPDDRVRVWELPTLGRIADHITAALARREGR